MTRRFLHLRHHLWANRSSVAVSSGSKSCTPVFSGRDLDVLDLRSLPHHVALKAI